MHGYTHGNTRFNFNSDLSGDVLIGTDGKQFAVSGESLLAFVSFWQREYQEQINLGVIRISLVGPTSPQAD